MSLDYYQRHAPELATSYQQISARSVHSHWLTLLEPRLAAAPPPELSWQSLILEGTHVRLP